MKAQFLIAFNLTMGNEGAYANDPDDKGGETYKGISRNNFPKWAGWPVIDAAKRSGLNGLNGRLAINGGLQQAVKSFYQGNFWDINKLGDLDNQLIANELFDTGVNMGTGIAARFLQEALNLCNKNQVLYKDIAEDGSIGAATIATANKAPVLAVLNTLNMLQGERYLEIMRRNKTQEKFWPSWLSRTVITGRW